MLANPIDFVIEPLADAHDRSYFSCGQPTLDGYLRTHAGQHGRKDMSKTYVAHLRQQSIVLGYYTIVASSISFESFPPALRKKLPHHPVPSILIARLAVDRSVQGMKLGRIMLMHALHLSSKVANDLGVYIVHVHAIDDNAKRFYEKFGFQSLPEQDRNLYLPMASIRKEFST